MHLLILPHDLLAQLIQWMDFEEITRLRLTTPAIKRRLEQEALVKELKITKIRANLSSLPPVSQWLTKLVINLSNNGPEFKLGITWLEHLPSSLQEIDFEFPTCLTIWLRGDTDGTIKWPFRTIKWPFNTSRECYAPIFICDRFPRLKRLRLEGNWYFGVPLTIEQGDKATENANGPTKLCWPLPMQALFFKKLPRDLERLSIPIPDPSLFQYLPPRLIGLSSRDITGLTEMKPMALPESLFDTLQELNVASFGLYISQFRNLRSLTGNAHPFLKSSLTFSFELLRFPSSLTDLRMGCLVLPWNIVARLPHSITRLHLLDCGETTMQGLEDPYENPWALLPSSLTDFHLHITGVPLKNTSNLSLLRTSLTNLTALSIKADDYEQLILKDLTWVPCDRLRKLSIRAAWESNALIWPTDIPNNIKELNLCRSVHDKEKSAVHFAQSLPPRLERLQLYPSNELDVGFLLHCPRTLSYIDLMATRNSRTFSYIELIDFMATRNPSQYDQFLAVWSSRELLSIKSAFRNLEVRVGIQIDGPALLEGTTTTTTITNLSRASVLEWVKSPENAVLNSAVWVGDLSLRWLDGTEYINTLVDQTLPSTLTSIDLPLRIKSDSPVWQLPLLENLQVESLETPLETKVQSPVRLKSLRVNKPFTSSFDCAVFRSLMELAVCFNMDETTANAEASSSITTLSRLERLEIRGIAMSSAGLEATHALFDAIPRSVAILNTDGFPITPHNPETSKSGNTPHWVTQLKCLDLRGKNWPMTDNDLRKLSPHIDEIFVDAFAITNSSKFYEGIKQGVTELNDLIMIQSLCPSITKLNGNLRKPVQWQFLDRPDLSGQLREESDLIVQQIERGSTPNFQEDLKLECDYSKCLAFLPRSLTHLQLSQWLPGMASHLPSTLLSLSIDPSSVIHVRDFMKGLPESLTSLSLPHFAIAPPFIEALPRGLKTLEVFGTCLLLPGSLKSLPPGLETLILLDGNLRTNAGLPRDTLTTLVVKFIEKSCVASLPPSLTRLECHVNGLKPQDLPHLSLVTAFLRDFTLHSQYFGNTDFWRVETQQQTSPFWMNKLDEMQQ